VTETSFLTVFKAQTYCLGPKIDTNLTLILLLRKISQTQRQASQTQRQASKFVFGQHKAD
jgi:hypothetical protein